MTADYLLSYGVLGDLGRFMSDTPLSLRRGQKTVVDGPRGVELATVVSSAAPGHTTFLPALAGRILRAADAEDEALADRRSGEAQRLLADVSRLVSEASLPVEVVDAEVLLDGRGAVVHLVRWDTFDPAPILRGLPPGGTLRLSFEDLTQTEPAETEGCGKPDCGEGGGNCETHGGCSTCGLKQAVDWKSYFSALREQQEARSAH